MEQLWTIRRAFGWCCDYLGRCGDAHARLSAEWLLGFACGLSRVEVYTHFDQPLSEEERARLRTVVRRRGEGEPLQYLTGEVGFRHLTLAIYPGVLIPRPETEVLVDLALELLPPAGQQELVVADLCTGSGCVGLALAQERPDLRVYASDLAPEAVTLANENARALGLDGRFSAVPGDLFDPLLPQPFDLIVANPPYVPRGTLDSLPREVAAYEPRLALDGGPDGLDCARRILDAARHRLRGGCGVIMELDASGTTQAAHFAVELKGYERADVRCDLTGRERFVVAVSRKPASDKKGSGSYEMF